MEQEIIKKFKNRKKLSKNELFYMVDNYCNDSINDDVMAEFLLLIKDNGLTYKETFYLTDAMIKSGDVLDLSSINRVVVDKHSTGGVGDKTTFLISPIVAACGLGVAKMSGRSLGFTGGTIDKLESIPGYRVNISNKEFVNNVNEIGVSLISQTGSLAPADKKIYALRDEVGAVESIPLIASSIMSKKIASGAPIIVIDLKVGTGAFMKDVKEAKKLAKYMIKIGKYFNRKVVCILTDMNSPLGTSVGNAVEVKEAIDFFEGIRNKRLEDLVVTLSTYMVSLGKNIKLKTAKEEVLKVLNNGEAKELFYKWIGNQGGDLEKLEVSKHEIIIKSNKAGFITSIDPIKTAELVSSLGAGREKKEDTIDLSVGIKFIKNLYDEVNKGEPICIIYTNDNIDDLDNQIFKAVKIESIKSEEKDIIINVIK